MAGGPQILDRNLQRRILILLAETYPGMIDLSSDQIEGPPDAIMREATYLREHRLIRWNDSRLLGGPRYPEDVQITAAGLDFLQDDGGLGRILSTVTIRFEDDAIRSLLVQMVENSQATPTVKDGLLQTLKSLPAEGLKSLSMKALEAGLQNLPNAAEWLGTWLTPSA